MVEVHGGLLFWSVITFLLLLIVLKKVAWGPIIDALESREAEIKNALNAAEKAKQEAEKVSSDYEKSMKDAQLKAQKIISDSKTAGEKIKADIESAADEKAAQILQDAKLQIESEKNKAMNDIRDMVVDLSIDIASKILDKEVDVNENQQMIDDTLKKIGQA